MKPHTFKSPKSKRVKTEGQSQRSSSSKKNKNKNKFTKLQNHGILDEQIPFYSIKDKPQEEPSELIRQIRKTFEDKINQLTKKYFGQKNCHKQFNSLPNLESSLLLTEFQSEKDFLNQNNFQISKNQEKINILFKETNNQKQKQTNHEFSQNYGQILGIYESCKSQQRLISKKLQKMSRLYEEQQNQLNLKFQQIISEIETIHSNAMYFLQEEKQKHLNQYEIQSQIYSFVLSLKKVKKAQLQRQKSSQMTKDNEGSKGVSICYFQSGDEMNKVLRLNETGCEIIKTVIKIQNDLHLKYQKVDQMTDSIVKFLNNIKFQDSLKYDSDLKSSRDKKQQTIINDQDVKFEKIGSLSVTEEKHQNVNFFEDGSGIISLQNLIQNQIQTIKQEQKILPKHVEPEMKQEEISKISMLKREQIQENKKIQIGDDCNKIIEQIDSIMNHQQSNILDIEQNNKEGNANEQNKGDDLEQNIEKSKKEETNVKYLQNFKKNQQINFQEFSPKGEDHQDQTQTKSHPNILPLTSNPTLEANLFIKSQNVLPNNQQPSQNSTPDDFIQSLLLSKSQNHLQNNHQNKQIIQTKQIIQHSIKQQLENTPLKQKTPTSKRSIKKLNSILKNNKHHDTSPNKIHQNSLIFDSSLQNQQIIKNQTKRSTHKLRNYRKTNPYSLFYSSIQEIKKKVTINSKQQSEINPKQHKIIDSTKRLNQQNLFRSYKSLEELPAYLKQFNQRKTIFNPQLNSLPFTLQLRMNEQSSNYQTNRHLSMNQLSSSRNTLKNVCFDNLRKQKFKFDKIKSCFLPQKITHKVKN